MPKEIPVQHSVPLKIINSTQQLTPSSTVAIQSHLPSWIKNTVRLWSHSQLSDDEFFKTIGYLVKQGILKMPATNPTVSSSHGVPAWVRSNADLWTNGQITDYEFLRGIEYMISAGIIT